MKLNMPYKTLNNTANFNFTFEIEPCLHFNFVVNAPPQHQGNGNETLSVAIKYGNLDETETEKYAKAKISHCDYNVNKSAGALSCLKKFEKCDQSTIISGRMRTDPEMKFVR